MLSYEEFKDQVVEVITEMTGKHTVCNPVRKNNGVILDGISIISPENNVSPNIYLNYFYEKYKEQIDIVDDALICTAKLIVKEYEQHLPKSGFDLNYLYDFANVRKNIKIKMLSIELNKELLEELVYIPFLDLAITFYVEIASSDFGVGHISIKNSMCSMWGIDAEELYEVALENMDGEFEITSLSEMFNAVEYIDKTDKLTDIFVITTRERTLGAAAIIMTEVLNVFAVDMGVDEVVIIPSSLHELILIPIYYCNEIDDINEMIRTINSTVVDRTEILSNHCYIYNRIKREVYI